MGDNVFIDGIMNKVPKVKEAAEKVEQATGKKVEDIASEIGEKVTEAIKEQGQDSPKEVLENIAGKIFNKKD